MKMTRAQFRRVVYWMKIGSLVIIFLGMHIHYTKKIETLEQVNANLKLQSQDTKKDAILLAELPEEKISLYGVPKDEGSYQEMILDIEGREKHFKWENIVTGTYYPRLILSDINQDHKKELVVILTDCTGTGVHQESLHIVNVEDLTEYNIKNIKEIIGENISSEVTINEELVKVNLKFKGEEYKWVMESESPHKWFDEVLFQVSMHYEVVDHTLYARLNGSIYLGYFVGEVLIEYKFEDDIFTDKNIEFKRLELDVSQKTRL